MTPQAWIVLSFGLAAAVEDVGGAGSRTGFQRRHSSRD